MIFKFSIMSYLKMIQRCHNTIRNDIMVTPLELNKRLSNLYKTNIFYKREDLQITRSFKIRGSLNKIKSVIQDNSYKNSNGLVCASAGNHAQGFAYSCNNLDLNGTIYVPNTTPLQKINRIKYYGKDNITIQTYGNDLQECLVEAMDTAQKENKLFIHPFNDTDIINGQSTVCYEIYKESIPDFIISPVGGGGLISGIINYSKALNPDCKIIGVEPENAESLKLAFDYGKPMIFETIDTFVDGASVPKVGDKTFDICYNNLDSLYSVSKLKLCHEIVNCYQDDGIILEPAGALGIACLDKLSNDYDLENKNVVIVLSGGNNDISRYNEIMRLNLEYMGLLHYFMIEFSQSPGQLKHFINNILDEETDIIHFEYIKKTNRFKGKVLIGFQLNNEKSITTLVNNLNINNILYEKIEYNDIYYDFLI